MIIIYPFRGARRAAPSSVAKISKEGLQLTSRGSAQDRSLRNATTAVCSAVRYASLPATWLAATASVGSMWEGDRKSGGCTTAMQLTRRSRHSTVSAPAGRIGYWAAKLDGMTCKRIR